MKVFNLWGAPCTGKSTTAAGIFYYCKIAGYKCELVTEYVKPLIYEGRSSVLNDQVYILAKQNRKLLTVKDKVDFVITDSPLPLGLFYQPEDYYTFYKPLLMEMYNSYDNVNILLTSSKGLGYQTEGRKQTEEEAKDLQNNIITFLMENDFDYTTIDMDPDNTEQNMKEIIEIINLYC